MQLSLPPTNGIAPPPSHGPTAPDNQVDFMAVLRVFTSRWWLILAVTVLCVGAGVLYIVRTPKMYASFAVLEGAQRTPSAIKNDENGTPRDPLEELHTFEQSLTNRSLLVAVARDLKLDQDARLIGDQPPTDAVLARAMSGLVGTELRRGTRLVNLSAKYFDPETAQKIADKIIEMYVAQGASMESSTSRKTRDYLNKELVRLEEKLKESDRALQEFRTQNESLPMESGFNSNQDRLKDLNAQLTQARSQRIRLESELASLEALSSGNPALLSQVTTIASAPEVLELQKMLAAKEAEFTVLTQRYLHKHPRYIQAAREVSDLRTSRDGALKNAADRIKMTHANALDTEKRLQDAISAQDRVALNQGKLQLPFIQLQNAVTSDRELYESVSLRLKELTVASAVALMNFRVTESPIVEPYPVSPRKKQVLAIALFGGVMLGSASALGLSLLSPRPVSAAVPGQPSRYGLPILVELPSSNRIPLEDAVQTASLPGCGSAENFRQLRASLHHLRQDREPRSVAITSVENGAGRSFCAMNLAVSYAREGLRTLLIETDLKSPVQSDALLEGRGLPALGLGEGLTAHLSPSAYCHHTMVPNLYLIPAGKTDANNQELLGSNSFQSLMMLAWNSFDRIILDTPAIAGMEPALTPLRYAEAVCVVVSDRPQASAKVMGDQIQKLLFQGHAPTGVILNSPLNTPAAFPPQNLDGKTSPLGRPSILQQVIHPETSSPTDIKLVRA